MLINVSVELFQNQLFLLVDMETILLVPSNKPGRDTA